MACCDIRVHSTRYVRFSLVLSGPTVIKSINSVKVVTVNHRALVCDVVCNSSICGSAIYSKCLVYVFFIPSASLNVFPIYFSPSFSLLRILQLCCSFNSSLIPSSLFLAAIIFLSSYFILHIYPLGYFLFHVRCARGILGNESAQSCHLFESLVNEIF